MMQKSFGGAIAAGLLSVGLFAGAACADTHDFFGNWANADPSSNDITRIVVHPAGPGQVTVQVFARCYPTDCDWGAVPGHAYVDTFNQHEVRIITASFDPGFAHTIVILRTSPGGDLGVQALTEFTDNSGRTDYEIRGKFHKVQFFPVPMPMPSMPLLPLPFQPHWPPAAPTPMPILPLMGPEDCIPISPSTVAVAHIAGGWKVVAGSTYLLDFGSDKPSADRAASVIIGEGFDQQCFVKRPNPSMMYWKSGGHVPNSQMPNQDCVGSDPIATAVAKIGGSWRIVQGPHGLLDFGPDQAAANQALAVIKKYHLNRQCFIQRPNPQMSYWLAQ